MSAESPLPLTLEEHRELGQEIRAASARLRELCAMMVGVYGAENRAARSFVKLTEAINSLRQELQTQAARDLPGDPVDGIYL
jgi:hypothetical protein